MDIIPTPSPSVQPFLTIPYFCCTFSAFGVEYFQFHLGRYLVLRVKNLYCIWLGMYVLCAGLGFIYERNVFFHILLNIFAICFYIPGIILLCRSIRSNDKKLLGQIRWLSLSSLLLTLLLIVANIAAVYASDTAGQILNVLLNLVSVPMFCLYWRGISLFIWACLFVSSFPRLWKKVI